MLLRSLSFALFVTLSALVTLTAQRPTLSTAVRAYVSVDAPLIALTHARVIDGTGAAPREDQTLILNNGIITTMGSSASTDVPAGAQTIDLTGKSVIPGLVMVHEHLYYPNGPGVYGQLGESFSRLYLSGGVTTMRTGGNVNGFMDLNMMRLVEAGQKPGPAIDATAPYLNGPNTFIQMRTLKGPEDARRQVQYWTDEGATSLKTYMQITRGELAAAINEAHRRGIKVTGHLCSVTYAEAASLGIDNLEHGFFAATDFVADKKPDECPGQGVGQKTIAALDENGAPFKTLVKTLIKKRGVDLDADRVRDVHAGTAEAARPRSADAAAARAVRAELRAHVAEQGIDLHDAVPERHGARARVRESGRPADRRHRSDRRRRRHPGIRESAAGRAAGRCRLHAARGDLDLDAERREVPRPRQDGRQPRGGQAGGPRRRSTAIPRRRSATSARWRPSSSRASATTLPS